ncbi:MAG TPA: DUF3426 domain-containing protein [Burkholderiales bacterium]|nr:DUF3426 domain-containing protein [Burkholderiales bacterium]
MKMVTRCPACATAFRIHRDQLDARGGQVRCGHCAVVFDAHANLQVEAELPPPMAEVAGQTDFAIHIETQPPEPDWLPDQEAVFVDTTPEFIEHETIDAAEVEEVSPPTLEELGFVPAKPRSGFLSFLWGLAIVVLSAALLLQAAYHFRDQFATYVPQLHSWLQSACEPVGCIVPLPQRSDLVSIEADEMQRDAERPDVLMLSAVLRNRAGFDQAYPDLELTLTNESQITVVRRVLRANEYLDAAHRGSQAFAANGEVALKLYIDATGLGASGYRMEVVHL